MVKRKENNMKKIKIGIYGYGNLGKGVEIALKNNSDMELVGVFTRRDPDTIETIFNDTKVYSAKEINNMARWLDCQFIIATHSPFMLGTLDAKIYNIDSKEYAVTKWSDLENVRYFYNFFKKNEKEFE